jgi:secretion/DNA translocation related TadE-like protein
MVTGVILGLAVVAWAVLGATSFLTAQHRARVAADLAALAGAQAILDANLPGDTATVACDAARTTAASHQATVDDCQVVAFSHFVAVQTTVSVSPPFAAPGFPERLEAVARAGNPNEG